MSPPRDSLSPVLHPLTPLRNTRTQPAPPLKPRAIFFAVRFDKLSYSEIAQRTGLTKAQVERELAKALMNYTRNLADPQRHWWRRHWPL